MKLNQITGIGRPLDPNYPTNVIIVILSGLFTLIGTVFQLFSGIDFLESILWGIQLGLAIFLCWAIARELDPDHPVSAFVGLPFTLLGFWFLGPSSLLFGFWLLVLSRVVNRTTGLSATILDSLLLFGLASWLTLQGNWIFGLATALAFYLDSRFSPKNSRQALFATATILITVILFALRRDVFGGFQFDTPTLVSAIVILFLFTPVIFTSRRVESVGDETGESINPRRVQAVQIISLLTAFQITVWSGGPSTQALAHLWGALLGISLHRLYVLILLPKSL